MWGDVAAWVGIVIAGGIGAWGVLVSRRAAASSAEAVDLARRAHSIQLESRHVTWTNSWDEGGEVLYVRNTGTDTAHNVMTWVNIEGFDERRDARVARLEPLSRLEIDISDVVAELRRRLAVEGRTDAHGFDSGHGRLSVRAWGVRWESASGVPETQDLSTMFTTLS